LRTREREGDSDRFGRLAERFVRLFGMPWFLAGQTIIVAGWIALNVIGSGLRFDPYPFILLNLLFSALAAYAAPLILLAQTRQADRDKLTASIDARNRENEALHQAELLRRDAAQTAQIATLLTENQRQTDHIVQLIEQTRHLQQRENEQTDLIASLASEATEAIRANQSLTREIHTRIVGREG
jgi:uncharacterized membrane protein